MVSAKARYRYPNLALRERNSTRQMYAFAMIKDSDWSCIVACGLLGMELFPAGWSHSSTKPSDKASSNNDALRRNCAALGSQAHHISYLYNTTTLRAHEVSRAFEPPFSSKRCPAWQQAFCSSFSTSTSPPSSSMHETSLSKHASCLSSSRCQFP